MHGSVLTQKPSVEELAVCGALHSWLSVFLANSGKCRGIPKTTSTLPLKVCVYISHSAGMGHMH